MSDKDVQRNVRSSGEEGVQTPKKRHFLSTGEKGSFPASQNRQAKVEKDRLLTKFREREAKGKQKIKSKP